MSERSTAEARRARAERRRAAREEFEAKQLAKLDAHMEEERLRWEREIELRRRDEERPESPGSFGVTVGPGTKPSVRRALVEGIE